MTGFFAAGTGGGYPPDPRPTPDGEAGHSGPVTRSGAVPLAARAVAPDVARGVMLLLIALANVHLYLYDRPVGVRLYPADPAGADRAVTLVQMTLVDGRAYPLFGLLFGYGIGQLTARRPDAAEVVGLVRRRGFALLAIGVAHVTLAWSGDIVAAYGLLAVLMARMLVAGTAVSLLTTAVIGVLAEAAALLSLGLGPEAPGAVLVARGTGWHPGALGLFCRAFLLLGLLAAGGDALLARGIGICRCLGGGGRLLLLLRHGILQGAKILVRFL